MHQLLTALRKDWNGFKEDPGFWVAEKWQSLKKRKTQIFISLVSAILSASSLALAASVSKSNKTLLAIVEQTRVLRGQDSLRRRQGIFEIRDGYKLLHYKFQNAPPHTEQRRYDDYEEGLSKEIREYFEKAVSEPILLEDTTMLRRWNLLKNDLTEKLFFLEQIVTDSMTLYPACATENDAPPLAINEIAKRREREADIQGCISKIQKEQNARKDLRFIDITKRLDAFFDSRIQPFLIEKYRSYNMQNPDSVSSDGTD